ncbi:MAG: hypothetical protein GPJ54_06445 [Candidatus Heimdallarchaeota archaeon]|nr:hypothetical protein [Candidatus Heimdallarchaeota archaeon]
MSSQGIDTAIQKFLTTLVDNIEEKIKSTGYAVPRSEIIGYLLEFFVVDGNLTEDRLNQMVGDVSQITQDLIAAKDIQWPEAPWYGRQIEYPLEVSDSSTLDQATSSQYMRFYQYVHGVFMIPSAYVLILVILSFSLAIIRSDPNSFKISVGIDMNPLYLFYYYAIFSLIFYPITVRISNNSQLRSGIEDMESWLTNMKKLAYFQSFSYGMFSFMMFIGSFAVVRIGTESAVLEETPANGIPLITTLFYIVFASFIYYHGIKRLWTHASGGSLRQTLGRPKYRIVGFGISISSFMKNVIIILVASGTILFINGFSAIRNNENVSLNGLSSLFLILTAIYAIIDFSTLLYFRLSTPTGYTYVLRKNLVRNNVIQIVNVIIFTIAYIAFSIEFINHSNEGPTTILGFLISLDFIKVIIPLILYLGLLQVAILFTDKHKEDDYYGISIT